MDRESASDNDSEAPIPFGPIVAAWLIPGAGHLLQKRWGRGLLLMLSIGALFAAGMSMKGHFFTFAFGNVVDSLGYMSDLGSGLFFLGAKLSGYEPGFDAGVNVVTSPIPDYGTKFILVAGLLNVLCILDAYDIAIGKKN